MMKQGEKKKRIVVRIEIATLSDDDEKLNKKKMDQLAMVLSNLQNSGKQLILVSSGAIALGAEKLKLNHQPASFIDKQAAAAVGQVELIKNYKRYFDEYNQIVAQVLLTSDTIDSNVRIKNTRNTFDTLLDMNIIPIVNENDAVSTADIELNDNYPLALNVAKIVNADIILIKLDANGKFLLIPKGEKKAVVANNEYELFEKINDICQNISQEKLVESNYPASINEIEY
jgi:glutamate 5-kinase